MLPGTCESRSGEAACRAILGITAAATRQMDLPAMLETVSTTLEPLVPSVGLAVFLADGERTPVLSPRLASQVGGARGSAEAARQMRLTFDRLERDRTTVLVEDLRTETGMPLGERIGTGFRSAALLPLTFRGDFVGVLTVLRSTPAPFPLHEVRILEDVASAMGSIVANAVATDEIRRLRGRLQEGTVVLGEDLTAAAASGGIIGSSPALQAVLERVARVAATGATVLISGETGTGKELIARAIHASSARAGGPLVKVNCAAFAPELVASELFGHERGAFTGALERRRGRFELAAGGTLFLDEVGELPPATQVALLRVLQEGEFERIGGNQTLRTDARVIAATNRDLEQAVREGRFRSDLHFRLNVFPIAVPPLRERAEDIPVLASFFVSHHARKLGRPVPRVSAGALEMLAAYAWPGNVRELQNIVERAVILARGGTLDCPDFELPGLAAGIDAGEGRIQEALRASRGRVSGSDGAAQALGVPASTLEARIRRLGIDKYRYRSAAKDAAAG